MYFHKCKNSYFRCSFVQVLVCTLDVEFNASLSNNSTQSDIFSQIETNDPKIWVFVLVNVLKKLVPVFFEILISPFLVVFLTEFFKVDVVILS